MPSVKFSAQRKFHLEQSRTRLWESSREQLSQYRVIYIISGQGKFLLNNEMHSYHTHGLIFLGPDGRPIFQEDNETEILVITFDTYLADDFQRKKAFSPDFADIYKQFENLVNDLKLTQGRPIYNERDARTIAYLFEQISIELNQQPAAFVKLIKASIDLVVTILARNNFVTKKVEEKVQEKTVGETLLEDLKQQIQQNKNVRVGDLLLRFNISEDVANLCILNLTGMSLRNFIVKYKSDLFRSRLLKVNITELARYA